VEQQRHLKAKICLVGEAAVGKTSLIRRFVQSQFSDDYLTTIGVKVSKKRLDVRVPEEEQPALLEVAVWDVMGQPQFRELLQEAYFAGVSNCGAVAAAVVAMTSEAAAAVRAKRCMKGPESCAGLAGLPVYRRAMASARTPTEIA